MHELAIDEQDNVYGADVSYNPATRGWFSDVWNRRLLKVNNDGKVQVILRSEPPYFPAGVAPAGGNLYVLEVGFTLPSAWSGPRIKKIDGAGKATFSRL